MKAYYLLFTIITISSCQSKIKSDNKPEKLESSKDTLTDPQPELNAEDKCISLVEKLPEVIELGEQINENSKEKNHLTLWVAADPSETKIKYYWIKAGEDNGYNIATLLNFYVNPNSEEILFYDIVNDTLVNLDFWREKLKN